MDVGRICSNRDCPNDNPQELSQFYLHRGHPRAICKTCHKARSAERLKVRRASPEGPLLRSQHADAERERRRMRRGAAFGKRSKRDPAARFWAKVNRDGPIPAASPDLGRCWLWTASTARFGYGQFWTGSRLTVASRFALELALGRPIAPDLMACHRCDNPPCVNPAHLYEGTQQVNVGDMVQRQRMWHDRPPEARLHPERTGSGDRSASRKYPGLRRGERNGNARLTAVQVAELRRRYAQGDVTQAVLATEFGIKPSHVSNIIRGRIWRLPQSA